MGSNLQHWSNTRWAELDAVSKIFGRIYQEGSMQPGSDITVPMAATTILAAALVNTLVIMLTRKGRRLVFNTVESVLSICLVILLLCFVLGLPVGAIFLVYKSAAYLLRSIAASSAVQGILNRVNGA